MMGLRLAEGVPLTRLERVAGRPWREFVDESALARLGDGGSSMCGTAGSSRPPPAGSGSTPCW